LEVEAFFFVYRNCDAPVNYTDFVQLLVPLFGNIV
jgi:hypothetical protein